MWKTMASKFYSSKDTLQSDLVEKTNWNVHSSTATTECNFVVYRICTSIYS